MKCSIKRNAVDKVTSITGQTEVTNGLVKDIINIPSVTNLNQAAEVYLNLEASELDLETYESITYESLEETYDNYEDLLFAKENKPFKVIATVGGQKITIIEDVLETNDNSAKGRVNKSILRGDIDTISYQKNGKVYYEPKGYNVLEKTQSTKRVVSNFGKHRASVEESNLINFEEETGFQDVNGEAAVKHMAKEVQKGEAKPKVDLTNVESSLTNFLRNLGISITTLENYKKDHEVRNGGKNLVVKALADVSNGIIVISKGQEAEIYEELSHIAVDHYADRESIEEALVEVANTSEYAKYAEDYKKAYSKDLTGVELETKVRKEVLGKIIAEKLKSKNQHPISKIREFVDKIWNYFTGNVVSNTKSYHGELIDKLSAKIVQAIRENDMSQFSENSFGQGQFFSLEGVQSSLNQDIDSLIHTFNGVFKKASDDISKVSFEKAREIDDQADYLRALTAIERSLAAVEHINRRLQDIEKDKTVSKADKLSYATVALQTRKNTQDILDKINDGDLSLKEKELKDKYANKLVLEYNKTKNIQEKLRKVLVEFGEEGQIQAEMDKGYSEKEARGMLNIVQYDIGKIFQWLAPISDAVNPVLSRLPKMISDMMTEAKILTNRSVSSFTNTLKEKGYIDGKYNKDVLLERDGQQVGELLSPHSKYDQTQARRKFNIEALVDILGLDMKTIPKDKLKQIEETIDNRESFKPLGVTSEQLLEYKKRQADNVRKTRINPNSSEYYDSREKDYEILGTENISRVHLKHLSAERNSILAKTYNEDGKPDRNLLSNTEKTRLEELQIERKIALNPFQQGSDDLKEGIKVKKIKDLTQEDLDNLPAPIKEFFQNSNGNLEVIVKDLDAVVISEEAQITLDLNNLQYNFYNKNLKEGKQEISKDYLTTLKKVEEEEGSVAAYLWLIDNGGLTASDELIDQIEGTVTYQEKVESYIETLEEGSLEREKAEAAIKDFERLNTLKKNLIKPYKNSDPFKELMIPNMDQELLDRLFKLEEELLDIKRSINLPLDESVEQENESEVFLNPNIKYLAGSEEQMVIFEYLTSKLSKDNRALTLEFERQLNRYERALSEGKTAYLDSKYVDFIDNSKTALKVEELNSKTFKERILLEYATNKSASFLKEYRPKGFQEFKKQLEGGSIKVSELVENKESAIEQNPVAAFYDVNPSFSWKEESDLGSTINPLYKQDQSFDTYDKLNDDFFNKFFNDPEKAKEDWVALEKDDISLLTPTKNKEAFDYLVTVTEFNKSTLENYGESEMVSKYELPQYMRSQLERTKDVASRKGIAALKESISDTFKNNADEMIEGQIIEELEDNQEARVIPKYGINRLKDQKSVSLDVVGSIAKLRADSELYKARVKYKDKLEGSVEYLKTKSVKNKYAGIRSSKSLRKGEDSNTYAMARNKVNEMLFGVKESYSVKTNIFGKEVDVTAAATGFNKIVQKINLAYSPIVDLTSLTSGLVNTEVEGLVGEFYSGKALARSKKILASLTGEYLAETGQISKKSKLNKIGEFLGLFEVKERLGNTQFDFITRNIAPSKSAFGFSELMNLPVGGQILIASLLDTKLVNGRFVNYQSFKRNKKAQSENKLTNKELKSLWNNIEGSSLYDFMDITGESITFNEKFKQEFPDNTEEAFLDATLAVSSVIKKLNAQADGMMSEVDQTEAKRNFISNFFMTHKSWFYLTMAKRFKGKGYDWMVGQETQGSYNNLFFEVLPTIVKNAKKLTSLEGIKELSQELSENELSTLSAKRVMIDTIMLLSLLGIGEMIMSGDEPDDGFLEDLAQLVYLRTVAETNSTNALGLYSNSIEMLKNPLVGLKQAEDANPIGIGYDLITQNWEEIGKRFQKNIPLVKRYYQMTNLDAEKGKYIRFNSNHLYNLKN